MRITLPAQVLYQFLHLLQSHTCYIIYRLSKCACQCRGIDEAALEVAIPELVGPATEVSVPSRLRSSAECSPAIFRAGVILVPDMKLLWLLHSERW